MVTAGLGGDPVAAIAAGHVHTVALKAEGSVWTWGDNSFGQLGVNTTISSSVPVLVTLLAGKTFTAVAAGDFHTVVLTTLGELYSWGGGTGGQLGDNGVTSSLVPVKVVGAEVWSAVAASASYTLALDVSSTLFAWGNNAYGQLGDGTTTSAVKPKKIMENVTAMAAGSDHTLALTPDGTVWAWGKNDHGQLGDDTVTNRTAPVHVMVNGGNGVLSGVIAIAAGVGHSAALLSDGTVWAWGDNDLGQVGDGMLTVEAHVATKVKDLRLFAECGLRPACDSASHACGFVPTSDGTACSIGTCLTGVCTVSGVAASSSSPSSSGVGAAASSGAAGGGSSSGSTGGAGPAGTIDYSCGIGVPSGSPCPSPRAAWLGAIALLALRRRRAGLRRTSPRSL